MKKASKGKDTTRPQGTLPKLKSHPKEPGPMPAGFTHGDVFFSPETTPPPFTNTQFEESAPISPHPLLNSKVAKDLSPSMIAKPTQKMVPPPPPAIPGQATFKFSSQTSPPPFPPKLVPPPPPVAFPLTPPPIPAPSPSESPPEDDEPPNQYPELGEEGEDTDLSQDVMPPLDTPNEEINQPIPPTEPTKMPADSKPITPTKFPNQLGRLFKQSKGIVELPLALAEPDFCGSLCVPVEEGHCVVLILLAKYLEIESQAVQITTDGLRLGGKNASHLPALQAEIASITSVAAKLQGDIAKDGPLVEQVISFLSGANITFLAPRAKIEPVTGPHGAIIGYFQGESLVQFVVCVALVTDGPVTHYLDLPFPAILGGGVETYLLPNNADTADFVRYLAAKNSVGWRGQKTRTVRHRILAKQNTLSRTLIWGGSAVVAYAFTAGLFGAFFPDLALSLSLLAPTILGAVITATVQLWRKAKRDMIAMNLALANRTSWRLVNFARDQVDRTVSQLQGVYKRQFIGEMCPQDALDTITKLGKTPTTELVQDPKLHEEVTIAASFIFGPTTGADGKQLMDALRHAINEVRHKRIGGAAKLVIAVTKARVHAILMKVARVPSPEMNTSMPLDVLFSASLSKAKFPMPTSISVPLLDLDHNVTSGVPVIREILTKAIRAAMSLVEHTRHFWSENNPDHVKEIPYTKASVPVVGEDFDNAFG